MKNILTLNYGSSSLKYALFKGLKRLEHGSIRTEGIQECKESVSLILRKLGRIDMIAHRVVHGMEHNSPMLIDGTGFELLKKLTVLDPLHNTLALAGVETCMKDLPGIPQYAIFDTSFYKDLPVTSKIYALPFDLYEKGIRRYGFHGISYSYLLKKSAKLLRKNANRVNLVMLHLGSGASICAVQEGKPVDTSMGMTPLEGLVMSTRAGDLDPGIILHLLKEGKSLQEVERVLYEECGIKGLTGASDMRQVIKSAKEGDKKARLALDLYIYRIKKYIGAYHAILPKLDALIFSGGVGENSPEVRELVCEGLEKLGIIIDKEMNRRTQLPLCVSHKRSKVKIFVIKTDEELEMIEQLRNAIKG